MQNSIDSLDLGFDQNLGFRMRSAGSLVRISRIKRCLSGSPVSEQANLFPKPNSLTVESDVQEAREKNFKPMSNDELYTLLDRFYREVGMC